VRRFINFSPITKSDMQKIENIRSSTDSADSVYLERQFFGKA